MWQDSHEEQIIHSHLPKMRGSGFISDVMSSLTKDSLKTAADAAGKVAIEGVTEGVKKTANEGVKRLGKKVTTKVLGEGRRAKTKPISLDEISSNSKKTAKKFEKNNRLTKVEEEILSFFEFTP